MAILGPDDLDSISLGANGELTVSGLEVLNPTIPGAMLDVDIVDGKVSAVGGIPFSGLPDPALLANIQSHLSGFGATKNETFYLDGDTVKMRVEAVSPTVLAAHSAYFRSKITGATSVEVNYADTLGGKNVQVVRGQVKIETAPASGVFSPASVTDARAAVAEMVTKNVFSALNGSPAAAEEGILYYDSTDNKVKALGRTEVGNRLMTRIHTLSGTDPDMSDAALRAKLETEFVDFYANDTAVMKSIARHTLNCLKRTRAAARKAAREANVTVGGVAIPGLKKKHNPFSEEARLEKLERSNNLVSRILQMMEAEVDDGHGHKRPKFADEHEIKKELRKEFAANLVNYAWDIANDCDVRAARAGKFAKEHKLDSLVAKMRREGRGPAAIREALEDRLGEDDFSKAETDELIAAANSLSEWSLRNIPLKTMRLFERIPFKKIAGGAAIGAVATVGAVGYGALKAWKYGEKLLGGAANLGGKELSSLGRTVPNLLKQAATSVFVNPFRALKNLVTTPARRLAQGARWGANYPGQPTIKPWKYNVFKGIGNLTRRAWHRAKQLALVPTAAVLLGAAGIVEGVKDAVVEDVVGLQPNGVDDTFGTRTYRFDNHDGGVVGTGLSLFNVAKGIVYDAPAAAFWDKPIPDLVVSGGAAHDHGHGEHKDDHAKHDEAHGDAAHGHGEHKDDHAKHDEAHGDAAHGHGEHKDDHAKHDETHGDAAHGAHHRASLLDAKQVGDGWKKYLETRKPADLGDAIDHTVDALGLDEHPKFGWLVSGAGTAVTAIAKWAWPEDEVHGVEIHADHIGKQILKLTDESRKGFLKGFNPEEHLDDYNLISDEDLLKNSLKTTDGHHKVEHQVVALFGKNGPYTEALLKKYTKDLLRHLKPEENLKPELAEKRGKLIRFIRKTSAILLQSDGHGGTYLKHIFDHEEEKKFTVDYDTFGNYILENVKEEKDRKAFVKAFVKTHGALGGKIRYLLDATTFDTAMDDEDERKTVKTQLYRLFDMEGTIYPGDVTRQAMLLKKALDPAYAAPATLATAVTEAPGTVKNLIQQIEVAEATLTTDRLKKLFNKEPAKITMNYEEFGDIVIEKVSDKPTAEAFYRSFKPDILQTKFEILCNPTELKKALGKKEGKDEIKTKIRELFNMSGSMGLDALVKRRDKMVSLLAHAALPAVPGGKNKHQEFEEITQGLLENLGWDFAATPPAPKSDNVWDKLYEEKPEVKTPDYAHFGTSMDHMGKKEIPAHLRGYNRSAFKKQFRPLWNKGALEKDVENEVPRKAALAQLYVLLGLTPGSNLTKGELTSMLGEYQTLIDPFRTTPSGSVTGIRDAEVQKGADEMYADLADIGTGIATQDLLEKLINGVKKSPYDNLYGAIASLDKEKMKGLKDMEMRARFPNLLAKAPKALSKLEKASAKDQLKKLFGTTSGLTEAVAKTNLTSMMTEVAVYKMDRDVGSEAAKLEATLGAMRGALDQGYLDDILS